MKIKVATFRHCEPGRKPMYSAYTRYYNTAWAGCMVFEVEAKNGTEAKKKAITSRKLVEGDL